MEEKVIKYQSSLFQQEVTLTIDERLDAIKLEDISPIKQEIANKQLEKIKDFLPKH